MRNGNPTTSLLRLERIKSFVRREGRMTPGQRRAFSSHWDRYGLELSDGLLDIYKVYGREAPLVLEIGFGMGQSLIELAQRHPEINYLGVEVYRPGVGALFAELEKQSISNVRVYSHDAVEVLQRCIADETLDEVLLFFPDPWPKKRHHKRRLVQPAFVEQVKSKLKPGGTFHMATDWEDYAKHMMKVMTQATAFTNQAGEGKFSKRPETRPQTKFETRGQKAGHDVWDLVFKRTF